MSVRKYDKIKQTSAFKEVALAEFSARNFAWWTRTLDRGTGRG